MKRILILSTDTAHHRYFINHLLDAGIPLVGCLFETDAIQPPFATEPVFEQEEAEYEKAFFFAKVRRDLDRIPVFSVPNINSPDGHQTIKEMNPDFGVVFGTRRLTPETIGLMPDGLINMHRGLTEEYRGLDSDLWAIYHRDWECLGVTVHMVESDLDAGPVVRQSRLSLKPNMKCHQIRFHTTVLTADLAQEALLSYLEGSLESRALERLGRYYSFMPVELKRIIAQRFNQYCENLPK